MPIARSRNFYVPLQYFHLSQRILSPPSTHTQFILLCLNARPLLPVTQRCQNFPNLLQRREVMSLRDLFAGLEVRLCGFSLQEESKYSEAVKQGGGIIVAGQTVIGSHLIACSSTICYDDPLCVRARRKGCIVVNEFWMDDSIDEGRLPDPGVVTYKPPHCLKGIDSFQGLRICSVGYTESETKQLKRIAELIGAAYCEEFEECQLTHLICDSLEHKAYGKAKEAGIAVVRKSWLEQCLQEWQIVSLETHSDYSFKTVSCTSSNTPHLSEVKNFRTPLRWGSEHKYIKAATTGSIRDRSPPITERPQSKTIRMLDYPQLDHIMFSDYLETINLTEKVHVPEHRSETMTNPDLKYVLQQALGLLLNEHLEQHSLGGLFSFKDFVISRKSKAMRLQNIHQFEYTAVSGQTDRDRFAKICEDLFGGKRNVPMDVYVWLDCIKRGVDGYILRRHINMQHPNETFGAFLTLYDAFMNLPSHHKETFKTLPTMQVYKQWQVHTFKWRVLKQSLQNKEALITAREEEARSMSTGANSYKASNNELMEEAYKDDLQGLLTFISDTFEHPAREYKKYMLAVMLVEYKAFLADLQEGLYLYGKLPQLKHWT